MKKVLMVLLVLVFSLMMFVSSAMAGEKTLRFNWDQENIPSDFAGWRIYISTISEGPYTQFGDDLIYDPEQTEFTTDKVQVAPDGQETTFYFIIKAFDTRANLSGTPDEISITIDFEAPDAPFSFTVTIVPE